MKQIKKMKKMNKSVFAYWTGREKKKRNDKKKNCGVKKKLDWKRRNRIEYLRFYIYIDQNVAFS